MLLPSSVPSPAEAAATPAHAVRVTFAGPELAGLVVEQPASSVRLVVPWPDEQLVIPDWTGNEFVVFVHFTDKNSKGRGAGKTAEQIAP